MRSGEFAAVLDEECSTWSNVALAAEITRRGGDVGHGYIAQLRKGRKDNPTRRTIEDLAGALGVHPARFVGGRRELHPGERPSWREHALRQLFDTADRPRSPEEVAAAIGSISGSYLRELLTGASDNPRLRHIHGLAGYFGVPAAYFFDADLARRVDEERTDLEAMRDLGVIEFATRLSERAPHLSARTRAAAIRAVTQALRTEEGERWSFDSPTVDGDGAS
ncbi:helix-turn-helix domain-containing protein [Kutzneria sp. NPDC051319]|uniref:helix-turn-helix domain-containing protein n=1 Tax=Kutzneria sp. NPDC051319 TaxID=3155047 RepID=UPI0034146099